MSVEKPILRPYQERCVRKAFEYLYDDKRTKPEVLVAPTAAGKSLIIAAIADGFDEPLLVLQPSAELLKQNHTKLLDYGFEADIYSASVGKKTLGKITFATLGSIKDLAEDLKLLGVRTVLIDEAHYGYPPEPGSMFMNFMNELKPRKVIGLTATPYLLRSSMSGSELKLLTRKRPKFFHDFLDIIQIQELTENNFWSRIDYKLYDFDESGLELNSTGSDFTEESIRRTLKAKGINNNIFLEIQDLQNQGVNSILVFMDTVENAEIMANHPKIKGATFIHGKMKKKDRDERVEGFKSGKYKVLINYGILTTGFDYPDLRCIIMGRPTLSLALYYQIVGRGTRISRETGKESCMFIDFCGTARRFGRVEDLVLEDVPGFGMAITSKDIVLTNVPIQGLLRTKTSLKQEQDAKEITVMPFGMHKGKPLTQVPISYIEYMLNKKDFNWNSDFMRRTKTKLQGVLIEHKANKEALKLNF
jgi:DNA repair protein RadD